MNGHRGRRRARGQRDERGGGAAVADKEKEEEKKTLLLMTLSGKKKQLTLSTKKVARPRKQTGRDVRKQTAAAQTSHFVLKTACLQL